MKFKKYKNILEKPTKDEIIGIIIRGLSSVLRLILPLAIVSSTGVETLGFYYLGTSIIQICCTFIGLEFAYYFSKKYLNESRDKNIIKYFLFAIICWTCTIYLSVIILSLFISLPVLPLKINLILFVSLAAIEVVSFEFGRFQWNVGNTKFASVRDLLRNFFYLIAINISLLYSDVAIGNIFIICIIIANIIIVVLDYICLIKISNINKPLLIIKENKKINIKEYFKIILPQFIENQFFSLYFLIERIAISSAMGVKGLAYYIFISMMLQTSTSIILNERLMKVRSGLIAEQPSFNSKNSIILSLNMIIVISIIIIPIAFITVYVFPVLFELIKSPIEKNYFSNFLILTALISSFFTIYAGAVSPMYSRQKEFFKNSLRTIILLSILSLLIVIYKNNEITNWLVMLVIVGVHAIVQSLLRVFDARKLLRN